MGNTLQTNFPGTVIKESEKDVKWYTQCVESITNRSLNQTYTLNYTMMNESINFFQGLNTGDEFKFLQESQDGEVLPAKWDNVNRIMSKLKIVIGEFMERGYKINVKGLNKEITSRRLEEKNRLLTEMRLQPVAMELEEESGLPLMSSEKLPEDLDELEETIENWKDRSELIMQTALNYLAAYYDWDAERSYLFRDILIMGRCFAKVELCNGLPKIRRIDPRLVIFDTNATNDMLSDSTYWGEVQYMPLAQASEKFGLSKEEVEQVFVGGKNADMTTFANSVMPDYTMSKDNNIVYYKQEGGELRVLVVTAYWRDIKPYKNLESVDKHGNEHIKEVDPDYNGKKGEKVIKKTIEVWRKGTLIGGKILREYGEMENQPRDIRSLGETCPPYIGLAPYFYNGMSISLTHQLKHLQNLKNIIAYNIQLAMSRAGTKSLVYDLAQLPEGWTEETVLKWTKSVGLIFINSKVDGIPSNFNQFSEIDLSISSSVEQYISLMAWVDQEMNAVSGINEAREGVVQGSSQAVGVTQSALFQSNLSTSSLFRLFRSFSSRALTYQAKLVKLAWTDKEKFASIIGDAGVDFINEDIDLDLNDYGVFVEEIPPIVDDMQLYQQFIIAAVQSQSLDPIEALKLLMEKDVKVGIRRYERVQRRKEQEMMEQEQAAAEQEQQAQASLQQQQFAVEQQKLAAEMDKENLKGNNALKQLLAKGKLDLTGKKLDILSK